MVYTVLIFACPISKETSGSHFDFNSMFCDFLLPSTCSYHAVDFPDKHGGCLRTSLCFFK